MKNTQNQSEFFKKLTLDREDSARTWEKPSMRGAKDSIVDKYSDQAHFIYELLQNADDAHATNAKFVLTHDGLIFTHNGTIGFTITNPDNEDDDTKEKRLGHINSITSIANSNKHTSTIGKFGVGFKSVFQYTNTPHIYDTNFRFKIERFFVPQLLELDHNQRQENETLFYFPFDLPNKSNEAYSDITQKLKSLVHPVIFLNNLQELNWKTPKDKGFYTKTIKEEKHYGETQSQLVKLVDGGRTKHLWLFTNNLAESTLKYSVGFFLDKNNRLDTSQNYSAFCYFPTKENTSLKFIIQAPFLLTDSREGIKAGYDWNNKFISKLAKLAAESLVILKEIGIEKESYLIDDNIINLIPYKKKLFSDLNDRNKISFLPFYTEIKTKLQSEILLPAKNHKYSNKNLSYWASDSELSDLFTDEQMADLMGTENAKWVFASTGRKSTQNESEYIDYRYVYLKTEYLDSLTLNFIDPEKLLRRINESFISKQSFQWLNEFYNYLLDKRSYWEILKKKPIFIDSNNNTVAAYDNETGKNLILFLPNEIETSYQTIHKDYLDNENTKKFFESFGITTPSLKDEIYNHIIPLYDSKVGIDTKAHFELFFKYFQECPSNEIKEYVKLIKDKEFLRYKSKNKDIIYRGRASYIYYPSNELLMYFDNKLDTNFLDIDFYKDFINEKPDEFKKFVIELGINNLPEILFKIANFSPENRRIRKLKTGTNDIFIYDKFIYGSEELMSSITFYKSKIFWNFIIQIIKSYDLKTFRTLIQGSHKYFYRTEKIDEFDSTEFIRLTTYKWLYNKQLLCVSSSEITAEDLANGYDTVSPEANFLLDFLGIPNPISKLNLSVEDRKIYERGKYTQNIPIEDLKKLNEEYRIKNIAKGVVSKNSHKNEVEVNNPFQKEETKRSIDEMFEGAIVNKQLEKTKELNKDNQIEKLKVEQEKELAEKSYIEELKIKVEDIPKYSVEWFSTLLELEFLQSGEERYGNKGITISFSRVERESEVGRIYVLKNPSRYIPASIEEIGGLEIIFKFKDKDDLCIGFEVANVRDYTLRVKAKLADEALLSSINFDTLSRAVIKTNNTGQLIAKLRTAFNSLKLEDTFCLKQNLPDNLHFVFGPPGTGKTTSLAKTWINGKMVAEPNVKMLILTPTNKACDVLLDKTITVAIDVINQSDWLFRFVTTSNESLESYVCERSMDIRDLNQLCLISTFARFPYDGFQNTNYSLKLKDVEWDYIIIDEASMIPLSYIIFAIYQCPNAQFIIAGDPFQIEPIVKESIWIGENIYTMVNLKSFASPSLEPKPFVVENLETQYRSLPAIGQIFSEYSYDGKLKHNRTQTNQRPLNLDNLEIKTVNYITFKVERFDSIFGTKKLSTSNVHIYSVLLSFEFANYLVQQINKNHKNEKYRIGIICPYAGQAQLIEKLWEQKRIDIFENIEIQVGTIHGFQGDECDIIITVFNPPMGIKGASDKVFLNKQNIINVAVSRARDYLFVLIPNEDMDGFEYLREINRLGKISKNQSKDIATFTSNEIENIIFKNKFYIQNNTFVTSHQLANVYSQPTQKYEVRIDENAVDIQINLEA